MGKTVYLNIAPGVLVVSEKASSPPVGTSFSMEAGEYKAFLLFMFQLFLNTIDLNDDEKKIFFQIKRMNHDALMEILFFLYGGIASCLLPSDGKTQEQLCELARFLFTSDRPCLNRVEVRNPLLGSDLKASQSLFNRSFSVLGINRIVDRLLQAIFNGDIISVKDIINKMNPSELNFAFSTKRKLITHLSHANITIEGKALEIALQADDHRSVAFLQSKMSDEEFELQVRNFLCVDDKSKLSTCYNERVERQKKEAKTLCEKLKLFQVECLDGYQQVFLDYFKKNPIYNPWVIIELLKIGERSYHTRRDLFYFQVIGFVQALMPPIWLKFFLNGIEFQDRSFDIPLSSPPTDVRSLIPDHLGVNCFLSCAVNSGSLTKLSEKRCAIMSSLLDRKPSFGLCCTQ